MKDFFSKCSVGRHMKDFFTFTEEVPKGYKKSLKVIRIPWFPFWSPAEVK